VTTFVGNLAPMSNVLKTGRNGYDLDEAAYLGPKSRDGSPPQKLVAALSPPSDHARLPA